MDDCPDCGHPMVQHEEAYRSRHGIWFALDFFDGHPELLDELLADHGERLLLCITCHDACPLPGPA